MILIDNKFIFANKLGEIAVYDSKNTKNALKKFHDHMGAVKDLAVDSESNLYSAGFDRYVLLYSLKNLKL